MRLTGASLMKTATLLRVSRGLRATVSRLCQHARIMGRQYQRRATVGENQLREKEVVVYIEKDCFEKNHVTTAAQVLLALVVLGNAETPSSTAATTTLSISATPETPSKYEKGKRTVSAEVSPQNVGYRFSEEAQPSSYITQQYVKVQSTKPQDLSHASQKAVTEPNKKESPEATYTLQYVPIQYISHAFDNLPKFQTAEYNQILQRTQLPLKVSTSAQNSIIPQQPYILPASFHSLTGSRPHYIPAPTTYHPTIAAFTSGHQTLSPASTYIVPQHSVPAYSLQPVVMMFTLPAGHYLNTAAGQNALLSFLGGVNSGNSVPSTRYVLPRQQLTYLIPPEAHPIAKQATSTYSQQTQHPEQQQQTSGSLVHSLKSPQLHQYQNIKG